VTPERQERLTRVGPGTPMGGLLRRYWHPVGVSGELLPGQARAVRLLGEDLVLFRTLGGTAGLVAASCPHRGASLACGHVDAAGIRCPYHGWQFDVAGRCVDMPAEGNPPALMARAATQAYPVEELGGLAFAYLGPAPAPLLPRYDLFTWEGVLRDIGRALIPCNWLQIMENSVDPTHVEWLHGHHMAGVRIAAGQPTPSHYGRRHRRIGFDVFPHGIIKRRVLEGRDESHDDWAVGHPLVFPCMLRVGAGGQHRFQIRVPVDDTHTLHYWYACYVPPPGRAAPPQERVPVYEVPWRDTHGNFITDFVDGGDIMAWVTQGPIADRTRELLVPSDHGVTLLRRLLDQQLDRVAAGEDPLGVIRDPAANQCIVFDQERDKFGGGPGFVREAIEMSHVRHSPLKDRIIDLLGLA
jgi:5,5'-dehydrodivanillate O-demethylase